jgi:18S rRNA (guanine1575-N7)-methyltransferase
VPFEKRRGEGGAAIAEKVARRKRAKKVAPKSRTWIIAKKEGQRRRGADIRPDTKYTGRKRKPRF